MTNNENCNKKPMDKLCDAQEALLLWDEYKYRHDLIWKHLIRSTAAIAILIAVPYSKNVIHNQFLIWFSAAVAIFYLGHTMWIIHREHELLENVKALHKKRQECYLELPSENGTAEDRKRAGKFYRRIVWYLILLFLAAIVAIFGTFFFKGISSSALEKAKISLKSLADSGVIILELTQSDMTIDKLKYSLKKVTVPPRPEKIELAGLPKLTAAIDKLTTAFDAQKEKTPAKSESDSKAAANDSCSRLESFLHKNKIPLYFENGEANPKGNLKGAFSTLVAYLKEDKEVSITLEGHTDSIGSEYSNYDLGQERVRAVKNMIVDEGVNQDRIFVVSYGKQLEKLSGGAVNEQFRRAIIKAARTWDGQCYSLK